MRNAQIFILNINLAQLVYSKLRTYVKFKEKVETKIIGIPHSEKFVFTVYQG